MTKRGLLVAYLESIGNVVEKLSCERRAGPSSPISLVVLSILVGTASFTPSLPPRLFTLVSVAIPVILTYKSRKLGEFAKIVVLTLAIIIPVSVPIVFITPGAKAASLNLWGLQLVVTDEGLRRFAEFVLRCTSASALAVSWVLYVGFSSLLRGLELIDPLISELVFMTVRYIPLSIREACRLLAAREARLFSGKRGVTWRVLASCCGELFLRCLERGRRVGLAIRARKFSAQERWRSSLNVTGLDALWISAGIGYVLMAIAGV